MGDEDDTEDNSNTSNVSQQSYLAVCRELKLTPIKHIYNGLATKQIVLKNQRLTLKDTRACTISLVKNVNVESLCLDANELGCRGAKLTNNLLGSRGAQTLCEELVNNTIIRTIDLSGNDFTEDDAVYFKELLEENNSISEMNLSHNNFQEIGGKIIAEGLVKNDFLKVLDLSWNHLRMAGAIALGATFKENSTLEVLRVGWNGFHLRGCIALGQSLSENNTLIELDLTCNRITDLCLGQLLKAFHNNNTLKTLKLPLNQISPRGGEIIIKLIEKHSSLALELVDLGNQSVLESFPVQAAELKEKRGIEFIHGPILRKGISFDSQVQEEKSDSLDTEDPFLVLMVYMRLQNLRLLELFSNMDRDASKSVTRTEFKQGMMKVNIPLSDWQLDKLISKLDNDRDGDVDFSELVQGQKDYKAETYEKGVVEGEETDIQRVSRKIEALMKKRFLMRKF
ncbi:leucine-rich repeat-containing protein 74A [Patella vulgata]|uniref:leucine-rich repeat-containing protein 74A n=1 Tax=Patella vulgata TaxID=6465 RepID=UPI0024A99A4C|nr:leucine-rich repeat-containing protein 74A [Patella vulgata]